MIRFVPLINFDGAQYVNFLFVEPQLDEVQLGARAADWGGVGGFPANLIMDHYWNELAE